jgi:hypothetical protein
MQATMAFHGPDRPGQTGYKTAFLTTKDSKHHKECTKNNVSLQSL